MEPTLSWPLDAPVSEVDVATGTTLPIVPMVTGDCGLLGLSGLTILVGLVVPVGEEEADIRDEVVVVDMDMGVAVDCFIRIVTAKRNTNTVTLSVVPIIYHTKKLVFQNEV